MEDWYPTIGVALFCRMGQVPEDVMFYQNSSPAVLGRRGLAGTVPLFCAVLARATAGLQQCTVRGGHIVRKAGLEEATTGDSNRSDNVVGTGQAGAGA